MILNKIVILTQYFPPETGAPQNRLLALAKFLQKKGIDVSILTAMPSYPKSEIFTGYKNRFYKVENINGINFHRSWLFVSKSTSIIYRLINYFSFVLTSLVIGLKVIDKRTDLIICESPPLFLGITAFLLKKIKKTNLLFNVSDLWPKTAEELGIIKNKHILNITTMLEEGIYKKSDMISGQTKGIVEDISIRIPGKPIFWYRNGRDFNTIVSNSGNTWRRNQNFTADDFLILYAGIFGYAQGLEICLRAANILKSNKNIHFVFYGSGPEEEGLIKYKEKNDLHNVTFFGHVEKDVLLSIIPEIDIGLIPLKNLPIFEGAIPSKIFDILAQKKPILLGIKGEAKRIFIDIAKAGLYFEPENENDLVEKIKIMVKNRKENKVLGQNGYNFILKEFNQEKILHNYLTFIKHHIA